MGLIKTADIKTKYSSHFDIILPWFPIYLKKICRDRNFDDIYILRYVNPNNHEAFYYKVSGEWGFTIRYNGIGYFSELNIGKGDFVKSYINFTIISPSRSSRPKSSRSWSQWIFR